MIGQLIPHYKILEKPACRQAGLGEVRLVLRSRTDETSSQSVLNYRIEL